MEDLMMILSYLDPAAHKRIKYAKVEQTELLKIIIVGILSLKRDNECLLKINKEQVRQSMHLQQRKFEFKKLEEPRPIVETTKLCEICGEKPGNRNSAYSFFNPSSTPDCGDWICDECEQEFETSSRYDSYKIGGI